MMQPMTTSWFSRKIESDHPSILVDILKREYISDKGEDTLISLSTGENHSTFPSILLRRKDRLERSKCLEDVKDKICRVIREDDSALTRRHLLGLAPIHLLCSLHSPGQLETLKLFCAERKSTVNALDSLSNTPLHHAFSPDNLEYHSNCYNSGESLLTIVKVLIRNGANVNISNCHGLAPLHLLLDYYRSGYSSHLDKLPELVDILKIGGADLNLTCSSSSMLHLAARLTSPNCLNILSMLSPNDGNINCLDKLKRTPLHYVIQSAISTKVDSSRRVHCTTHDHFMLSDCVRATAKVEYLLSQGANVNSEDLECDTPLIMAIEMFNYSGCVRLVEVLLEHNANVTAKDVNGQTPLHLACKYLKNEVSLIISLLLRAGASINEQDWNLRTPLYYALERPCCSLKSLEYLVEEGADVTLMDCEGNNAIHAVCCSAPFPHFKEVLPFLVKRGCDVNQINKHGNTPLLDLLLRDYNKESIEILIGLEADCRVRNFEQITPLHLVSRSLTYHKDIDEIVDVILKGGGDVNARDCLGSTPLHYAVRDESTSNFKAIRNLLMAGADPNISASSGVTPLHIVCSSGGDHLAKMLIDFGAEVNKEDAMGNTPLHIVQAVADRAASTARVLIEHGANICAKNRNNSTPFSLMTRNTHHFMIGYTVLLIAAGKYTLTDEETALLDQHKVFSVRYSDCFSCVNAIKTHFIGNSSVTLLDFLLSKNERASRYVRNPEILLDLSFIVSSVKYRWYSKMIEDKLNDALFLNELHDRSARSLIVAFAPVRLPENVIEKFMSYLNENDMNALNRAVITQSLI